MTRLAMVGDVMLGRLVNEALKEFREHLGGEINITLLDGIGHKIEALA